MGVGLPKPLAAKLIFHPMEHWSGCGSGPRVWGEASEKGRLGKLRADRQADLRHLKLSTGLMEDDRARPCRSCRRVEACDTEGLM